MNPLMTPGELRVYLGMGSSAFYLHQKRGAFKHLLSVRPVGTRRYARTLVEAWERNQPVRLLRRA